MPPKSIEKMLAEIAPNVDWFSLCTVEGSGEFCFEWSYKSHKRYFNTAHCATPLQAVQLAYQEIVRDPTPA